MWVETVKYKENKRSDYHTIRTLVTFKEEEWSLDCEWIYRFGDTFLH